MKIDGGSATPGFDRAERFQNLRGRLHQAARHGLRRDLRSVREALEANDPAAAKAAVETLHDHVDTIVDAAKIRDDKHQIREDLNSGASFDAIRADILALKDDLRSFLDSAEGVDKRAVIASFKQALREVFHDFRARNHHDVETPTPVEGDPAAAPAPETVTSTPGAVDFSA